MRGFPISPIRPIAIFALVLLCGWSAPAEPTPLPTPTATPVRLAPEPPAADPEVSEEIQQLVQTVQERVSLLRGLPSKTPVNYRPLTPEKLQQFLRDTIDEHYPPDTLHAIELTMRRLGLFRPDDSLDEIFIALFSEQVAGLYDEQTGTLYVVTSFDLQTVLAEIILAHEICHALQDQHYDLKSWPIKETDNDDRASAAMAVLEGDATILMSDYAAFHLTPGRLLRQLPQLMGSLGGNQPGLQNAPYIIQQQMLFPYIQGAAFMQEAISRNARDEALENYPRSTEQILHPEKYFSDSPDEPIAVCLEAVQDSLPEGWTWRYQNVMGQMGTRLFLEANFNPFARRASEGWGGDRYALAGPTADTPLTEERYALVWKTVWDTEEDAVDFFRAMDKTCVDRLHKTPGETPAEGRRVFQSDPFVAELRRQGDVVIYVDTPCAALTTALADRALDAEAVGAAPVAAAH